MQSTPTAAFYANFPLDEEYPDPIGCYLARKLASRLSALGRCEEFNNWRDCGWSIECKLGNRLFEIFFCKLAESDYLQTSWILGIASIDQPGFFRRLLGAKSVSYSQECQELTIAVHGVLENDPHISKIRWAMSNDPSESSITHPNNMKWDES